MQSTQQTSSFWMYVFFIMFLGILGLVGYGAYSLLSNPAHYAEQVWQTQREQTLTKESQTTTTTKPEPDTKITEPAPTEQKIEQSTVVGLPAKIDDLIKRNTTLKQGNRGNDVGTIQEFMNQYYKRNDKIDNDFGPELAALVKKFQTSQKLPSTGQVASRTLGAMKSLAK
jgi:peptidoglycan hydrolase-like protein with peptidoglycan-binding domain